MAGNLARLRSLVLASDADSLVIATLIFHGFPDPTIQQTITAPEVESYVEWMMRSPYPSYGRLAGKTFRSREELFDLLARFDASASRGVADLVNAMATADAAWDRRARAAATNDVVANTANAAILSGQSALEFVALENVVAAGYATVTAATTAIELLIKSRGIDRLGEDTMQLRRSRKAVAASWIEAATGLRRHFISPWFLSKQACLCLLAHYVRDAHRLRVQDVAQRRGQTAISYEARAGLEAVRSILEPAAAILRNCRYDPDMLAFVDMHGRKAYDIATRVKHVLVAFSYVHSRGSSDVLMELANARLALQAPDISACQAYSDFEEAEDVDEMGMVVLFARTLHDTRDQRDELGYGDGLNKPPCIGYVMRARGDEERNSVACMARCQEVASTLRFRGEDAQQQLFAVHWEGDLDPDIVIAGLAVAKIDVAVDVGVASVSVPGAPASVGESESSYIVLLASAEQRGLSRILRLPYPTGMSVDARIQLLSEFYTSSGPGSVVYLGGGSTMSGKPSAQTCADANAITKMVSSQVSALTTVFGTCDFILPSLCGIHARRSTRERALETNGVFESGCHQCETFGRGLRDIVELISMPGVRFVKPRSAYAHNSHFAVEVYGTGEPEFDDTATTISASNFITATRNAGWGGELLIPERGDPYHKNFMDAMSLITRMSYEQLSGANPPGPVPDADLASIARSLN